LPVAQARVARPTRRLSEVKKFYREGIGLALISKAELCRSRKALYEYPRAVASSCRRAVEETSNCYP